MMIARLLMLALIAASSACQQAGNPTEPLRAEAGQSVEGVALGVDKSRYSHGDTIELRLVNTGSANVGYNLCSSARERERSSGWGERIESLRMCTAALYPLSPGSTAADLEPVETEWGTGRYRIVTTIYLGEPLAGRLVSSGIFEVGP